MISARNYFAAALFERLPLITSTIGALETALVGRKSAHVEIDRPIFICGLPRSGSTKILEILNRHPEIESLQYDDFPYLFIPYLWNRFLKRILVRKREPVERIHEDRIMVTPESPESFEEIIWIDHFNGCHESYRSHVMCHETNSPRFEKAYSDFIKKLLLGRGGSRYLSKAHYNTTRIEYILKLFPNARFIIPIRSPVSQVCSLVRQQSHFNRIIDESPLIGNHMRRMGHFEFGPHRRPIHTGDHERVQIINKLWGDGREVEGYAHLWDLLYGFLLSLMESGRVPHGSIMVIKYEEFCSDTAELVERILKHVGLKNQEGIASECSEEISLPDYYTRTLSRQQELEIQRITGETASKYGYNTR